MTESVSPKEILPAGACAKISAIDSASLSNLPLEPYFHSDLPRLQRVTVPAFSFVITNAHGRCVLFDLGLRKDWTELSPTAVAEVYHDNLGIQCEKDVRDILEAHEVSAESVEAIILRFVFHLFARVFPIDAFRQGRKGKGERLLVR